MSLGSLLGLLALGGVPAIVAIHLLRVRARRISVSTLFLVPTSRDESPEGRRFDRLRATPLFWIQILIVLLLTWVLVEPRWLREDSTLRVVLVVDGSASMSAFEAAQPEALRRNLSRLEKAASRAEWIVLASDPREKTLYAGASLEEAIAAAGSLRARLPAHDPRPVLATARSIASDSGIVVYVTDRIVSVPAGVELLAVGSPIDNVGFAGLDIAEDGSYRAMVKSSSAKREVRRFWVERAGSAPPAAEALELGPYELRFVAGRLEAGEETRTLVLEQDGFPLDDRLPLVRPRPRVLRVFAAPELSSNPFIDRFLESLSAVERVAGPAEADLVLGRHAADTRPAIVFAAPGAGATTNPGALVSEKDPLTDGLSFQGLLASPSGQPDAARTLLWQGERALVSVREEPAPALVLNFALEESNADRIPAFVLLLHRYAESVRASIDGFEQRNVELHQLVDGTRAPGEPGFFEVRKDDRLRLRAAARFADVREADFTDAAAQELPSEIDREKRSRNSLPDPFQPLWLSGLLGLSLLAAALQESPGSESARS